MAVPSSILGDNCILSIAFDAQQTCRQHYDQAQAKSIALLWLLFYLKVIFVHCVQVCNRTMAHWQRSRVV